MNRRQMIVNRKKAPCGDCLCDPRMRAIADIWPVASKVLDQRHKMFWMSVGSDKANRRRTGRQLTYTQVSEEVFLAGLAESDVVCASHMNWRTALRRIGSCIDCAGEDHPGNKCKCSCHTKGKML